MKNLTKVAVMVIAIDLMKDNGTTSTLEVKEALRAEGYFAKQSEVSKFMYELALEEDWNIDENGEYRKFSLEEEPEINDDDDDDNIINEINVTNGAAGVKIMHKDHKGNSYPVYIQEKSITRATTGDWCVQDEAGSIEKFYDAIYTRDEVRSAFAKSTDTRFVDTRSYKMK